MNKAQIAVIAAGLVLAAGAFAQDAVKRTEQIQNSAEQMKPQMNPPERTMAAPSHAETAAERKAREMRESSEMMKPQTAPWTRRRCPARRAPQRPRRRRKGRSRR